MSKLINSRISDDIKSTMQSTEELAPRLYGLPKIHKDTVLLPPIISTIGFSSYYLARYIAFLLQKYIVGTATYRYICQTHFVEKLQIRISLHDSLVSFDVVSLFTRVPIRYASELLEEKDITALLEHSLAKIYVCWNGDLTVRWCRCGKTIKTAGSYFFHRRF